MTENETIAAHPDLSALPWETRVNLLFAEMLDGAKWAKLNTAWFLFQSEAAARKAAEPLVVGKRYGPSAPEDRALAYLHPDEPTVYPELRDYLNDDAAAWSLMVRETAGVKFDSPDAVGLLWRTRAVGGDDVLYLDEVPVPFFMDRDAAARRAVALTVLTKYADGPFSEVIRPLLENVP